jgi:hypothetical protein
LIGTLAKHFEINGFPNRLNAILSIFQTITIEKNKVKFPEHPQGVIPAFAGTGSAAYCSLRLLSLLGLASSTLPVFGNLPKRTDFSDERRI